MLPRRIAAVVAIDEVLMRVRDASNWRGSAAASATRHWLAEPTPPAPNPTLRAYATEGKADPYAGFKTRVVPENVTLLSKDQRADHRRQSSDERVHIVRKGETVSSILRDPGATPDEVKAIAAKLGARGRDGGLKEGQKIRILMVPPGPAPPPAAAYRVIVANEATIEAVVALSDIGKYVTVDVQSINTSPRLQQQRRRR